MRRALPFSLSATPLSGVVLAILASRASLENIFGALPINLGGVSITGGFILNLVVVACFAFIFLMERTVSLAKFFVCAWLPFLLVATVGMFRSPNVADAFKVLFNYLSYAAIFFLALRYSFYADRERQNLLVVLLSAVIPLGYAIVQLVILHPEADGDAGVRIASTFAHPNILAFYLLATLSYVYAQLLARPISQGFTAASLLFLAVGGSVLLVTGTRSAWLAMYLFTCLYTLFVRPRYVALLLILPLLAFLVPEFRERISEIFYATDPGVDLARLSSIASGQVAGSSPIELNSYVWRKLLWKAAWSWIEIKPITGYGLESFPANSHIFFPIETSKGAAHNIYIQLLFELGVLGLIAYFWIFIFSAVSVVKTNGARWIKIFVITSFIAFSVASYSDNMLYYLPVNWFFWFIAGSMVGQAKRPDIDRKWAAQPLQSPPGRTPVRRSRPA